MRSRCRLIIADRPTGSSPTPRPGRHTPWSPGGIALALALAGCGSVGGAADAALSIDAATGDDAAADATRVAICDPTAAFDTPGLLRGFSTSADEVAPRLSQDELTLYFSSNPAAATQAHDLYVAQRSRVEDPFGSAMPLTPINSTAEDYDPSLSADGKTLVFTSNRKGEGFHIYVATRASTLAAFTSADLLDGVASTNTADNDIFPFLSADGQELWFASNRMHADTANYDIYRAVRGTLGFVNPSPVTELNTDMTELAVPSADLKTVYFHSTRGGGTIWSSHRTTTSDGFPTPHEATDLAIGLTEIPGWLSPDNCRLYLNSSSPGDLYVATRHPQ